MEKEKKHKVTVHRGKRKDFVTVEGPLLGKPIKITSHITSWAHLLGEVINNAEGAKPKEACHTLGKYLFKDFIVPANMPVVKKLFFSPRGKHKQCMPFIMMLKYASAIFYNCFAVELKKPKKEWPTSFKKFVNLTGARGKTKSGSVTPLDLTLFAMEQEAGAVAKELGLDPFSDSENFYKTYILEGRKILKDPFMRNTVEMGVKITAGLSDPKSTEKALDDMLDGRR